MSTFVIIISTIGYSCFAAVFITFMFRGRKFIDSDLSTRFEKLVMTGIIVLILSTLWN